MGIGKDMPYVKYISIYVCMYVSMDSYVCAIVWAYYVCVCVGNFAMAFPRLALAAPVVGMLIGVDLLTLI